MLEIKTILSASAKITIDMYSMKLKITIADICSVNLILHTRLHHLMVVVIVKMDRWMLEFYITYKCSKLCRPITNTLW